MRMGLMIESRTRLIHFKQNVHSGILKCTCWKIAKKHLIVCVGTSSVLFPRTSLSFTLFLSFFTVAYSSHLQCRLLTITWVCHCRSFFSFHFFSMIFPVEQKLTAKHIQLILKFNLQLFKCFNCRTSGWEWMDRNDSEFESQHLHAIILSTTDFTFYTQHAQILRWIWMCSTILWHFYLYPCVSLALSFLPHWNKTHISTNRKTADFIGEIVE